MSNRPTYEELEKRVQELEQVELKRKITEEELDQIFSMSLDMICIADINTATFIKINPAFTEILGYSEEELLKKSFFDFIHPEDIDATQAVTEKKLQKGTKVINFDNRYRCKDESYRWLSWVSRPNIEKGITFAVARDITKHKLLEQDLERHRGELEEIVRERTKELVESEERYRTVMAAAPNPMIVYDKSGKVLFINLAFTRIFGWTFEEIFGKKMAFVPEESRKATQNAIQQAFNESQCLGFETQRYTKNGDLLDVSINAAEYLDSDGKSRGLIVNLRDITAWKKTNAIMVQTEKMMSLGGLAAGMAHEINNPLAGILHSAQVALNRVTKPITANQKAADEIGISMDQVTAYLEKRNVINMLSSIREAGRRAAKIVDDMLAFSKNRGSKRAPHDLVILIEKALSLAEKNYDLKKGYDFSKIEVIRRFEKNLSKVPCEENKVQQVILNILKNGVQAMAEQNIKNPRFILCCRLDNQMIRIDIEDNGPGMDEAVAKRTFEPFFTTKVEGEGTGLGMSVSYYIITQDHGGIIEIDTKPSKGTTFIIRLPIKREINRQNLGTPT